MTGNTGLTTGLSIGLTTNPPAVDPALQAQLSATNPINPTFRPDRLEPIATDHSLHAIADSALDSKADEITFADDPHSWRSEVTARLDRYRTRRKPRPPHYPSLLLPFDASGSWLRNPPLVSQATPALEAWSSPESALEVQSEVRSASEKIATPDSALIESENRQNPKYDQPSPNQSAKVIEFPRSAAIPVFHAAELADPIFDRPRIVEAPEILPPPPALGGMLIEAVHKEPVDLKTDSPSASASVPRRALAAAVDGMILMTAIAAFATIFLHFNPVRPLLPIQGTALGVAAVLLWMAYEFLFVVYTGSTLGLRIARLGIATFDGAPLNRRTRRWRVLASFLSAFSAGLGYFWCLLDQDGLCWHDRITRTNVQLHRAPAREKKASGKKQAPALEPSGNDQQPSDQGNSEAGLN
jgi:uncharacterized RDD family membrane protein YckC